MSVINSTWNGGTGNWNTGTSWTPAGVPNNGGNTFNVTIGTGVDTVSLNLSPTITSLTLGTSSGTSSLFNLTNTTDTLTTTGALTINFGGRLNFNDHSGLVIGGGGSNAGFFDLEQGSTAKITGNFTNTGSLTTNNNNQAGGANTFTLTGTLTNNSGAKVSVGAFDDTTDVMNTGTLTNNGFVRIGAGATLNLTSQPNGITDVVAGSDFDVFGSFKAGSASAVAKLGSIEGVLDMENSQTTTVTPGSGTLTVANTGTFDLQRHSTVTVSGNLTNSGTVITNRQNTVVGANTLTVTGALTNNAGALVYLGQFDDTADVLNTATLTNKGFMRIGAESTLNLTGQPNGVTDVVAGSEFDVFGSFKAGSASAVAKLGSIEGVLDMENSQTTTVTPGSGTLTVSNTGTFDAQRHSTATVSGNLTNSGTVSTNRQNTVTTVVGPNTLTVTGALTNNAGATVSLGNFDDTTDVLNTATLTNKGFMRIGAGSTLNLTAQPNGVTDVVAGSEFDVLGNFKAGSASAVAKLGSIEGILDMENSQTTTVTPGSGTLTIANTGTFDVQRHSTVTVSGNLTNSGTVSTNRQNTVTTVVGPNTLTVTGALTNNAGATVSLGNFDDTTDVLNTATLANKGLIRIGVGSTLNLTGQPNGVTDVVAGSEFDVFGSFKAGSASAVAKVGSIEGILDMENTQSTTMTPASGTLTVSNGATLDDQRHSTVTISGNLTNSGTVSTNRQNTVNTVVGPNTLTVTGALTNNAGATVSLGNFDDTTDVLNTATLTNKGLIRIGVGSTLNLTGQPNGVTDVVAGSEFDVFGSFKAGSASAVAKLGSIEGILDMENGQSTTITPGSGTLTVSTGATLDAQRHSTVTVSGNLTNSGTVSTNRQNTVTTVVGPNTLTVTGTLINNTGASVSIGNFNDTTDILKAGLLSNSGSVVVGTGASLNLTSSGTDTNNSTITLTGSTLKISGATTTLSGKGTVSLSNSASNLITGGTGVTLTTASTIQGSGTISNLAIVNTGTLSANQSTPLIILPAAGGLNNKGILNVNTGDTMRIGTSAGGALTNLSGTTLTGGTYTVSGTMQLGASGTSIVTDAANITLTGASSQIIDFGSNNVLAKLATISSGSSFNLGAARSFTTAGNFTNNGTLTVGGGDTFKVNGNLTNFSGTTLTGGTYNVGGTLSFNSANIVTNAANITLTGASSNILSNTATNALTNFATNNAGATFALGAGRSFTTAGNFTDNGTLTVGSGDTFKVNGNLTNFSGTTLNSGIYNVTGTLQFNGANIVTNAANITLSGTTFKILDQSSNNGIAKFANNSGTFALASTAALTTAGGNFTNSGTFTVNTGSVFTVGGSSFNFTQTAGKSTIDGMLQGAGAGTLSLNGGSLFGGGTLGYAVTDKGTITPGDSSTKTGILTVSKTYTQNSAGALDISIGGATQGTQYDALKVTSTATLNGTLNVSRVNNFTPTIGQTFDIVHGASLTGAFSTINGLSINGSEHFSLSQTATDIILTVVSGAAGPNAVISPGLIPRWRRAVVLPAHTGPGAAVTTPAIVPPQPRHNSFGMAMASRVRRLDAGIPQVMPTLAIPPTVPNSPAAFIQAPAANFSKTVGPNPSRFECGIDLGALLKASPRKLWRSFVSDSPEVANIGYVAMIHGSSAAGEFRDAPASSETRFCRISAKTACDKRKVDRWILLPPAGEVEP
jgi:hypothetical protein